MSPNMVFIKKQRKAKCQRERLRPRRVRWSFPGNSPKEEREEGTWVKNCSLCPVTVLTILGSCWLCKVIKQECLVLCSESAELLL